MSINGIELAKQALLGKINGSLCKAVILIGTLRDFSTWWVFWRALLVSLSRLCVHIDDSIEQNVTMIIACCLTVYFFVFLFPFLVVMTHRRARAQQPENPIKQYNIDMA